MFKRLRDGGTQGARAIITNWFEVRSGRRGGKLSYRGTTQAVDGARVVLNSDLPYPETNVRCFMADIAPGGSLEFYRAAAERDHEMGCLEAVRRTEEGYKITNLDQFERKKVDGKTLITSKGSNEHMSGMLVKLSSGWTGSRNSFPLPWRFGIKTGP